jgi:hypothetical protein
VTEPHYDLLFVEWTEPDDGAFEDPVDRDSWTWGAAAGEPEYSPAPLPAHERRWRHPSELGHDAWVQSEKTASVGRGLLVTSGAIGCILGLAVVWLMVPGPGSPPSADPIVARSDLAASTTAGFAFVTTTAPAATAPATTVAAAPTLPSAPSTVAVEAPPQTEVAAPEPTVSVPPTSATLQLPAEDLPTNTVWLKSDADGSTPAVAVLVGESPYMITTATAVGTVDSVRVMLTSGGVTNAPVVSVDDTFAYLEADESLATYGFANAAIAATGDSLTVLTDAQVVFTLGDETLASVDPQSIAEGTPVVNEDGALVGLCTAASGTIELVSIAGALPDDDAVDDDDDASGSSGPSVTPTSAAPTNAADTLPAVPSTATATTAPPTSTSSASSTTTTSTTTTSVATTTTATPTPNAAWIGIRLGGDKVSPSPLTISAVTAGSPADAAGLVVGEELVAVDGTAVSTVGDVAALVEARSPGDTITVTVASDRAARPLRTQRDVRVVLGEHSL